MIFHPSNLRLKQFADGEISGRKRARIAAHLRGCPRCRDEVTFLRALTRSMLEAAEPPFPENAWEGIAARISSGERMILPIASGEATTRKSSSLRWAAIAATGLLGGGLFLFGIAPEAGAQKSELRLSPANPGVGEVVAVEYAPRSSLAGESRLRLRARFRTADDHPYAFRVRHLTVGELVRGTDGRFRASIELPESVVYAAFAVEDVQGKRVDHNGHRLWEVLVHASDGRPLFAALEQRIFDLMGRNWTEAHATTREMTRLYPEEPRAWSYLIAYDEDVLDGAALDSARAWHHERFQTLHRQLSVRDDLPAEKVNGMLNYAFDGGDPEALRHWDERLKREFPQHPQAIFRRASDLSRAHRGEPGQFLAELEHLWGEVDSIAGQAYRLLIKTGYQGSYDVGPDEYLRWVGRFDERIVDRWASEYMALPMLKWPESREQGIERLRQRIERLGRVENEDRDLELTIEEQRAENQSKIADALGAMGEALIASGDTASGVAALDRALSVSWNTSVFKTVAEAKLALGDTMGAARAWTRLLVDPSVDATLGDSIRIKLGRVLDRETVQQWAERAREEMRQRVLARAVNIPLRDARLRGRDGEIFHMRDLSDGQVTVVTFWKRSCGISRQQLPAFAALSTELERQGVRVIAITEEEPSPDLATFLQGQKLDAIPVYHDYGKEASVVFNNSATPTYYVLDEAGRLRFELSTLAEIARQVSVLRSDSSSKELSIERVSM